MVRIKQYLNDVLGIDIDPMPIDKSITDRFPIYLSGLYRFYTISLFNRELVLILPKNSDDLKVSQVKKHCELLKNSLQKLVVLVTDEMPAYNRRRLINQGVNFIVPDKQLFLPDLLIDLREISNRHRKKSSNEKLLPSTQFLILYFILHRSKNGILENQSLKELAERLGYTAAAISKITNELENSGLIRVEGEKEKYIRFELSRADLWTVLLQRNLWVNPVLKKIYVDHKPEEAVLLTNTSALPEYSDMNPSRQEYYAIEKTAYYSLQKKGQLINPNDYEGKYCLEVWKYNPLRLAMVLGNELKAVDPLSLYLSLKETTDERIEMALKQIEDKYIW